MMKNISVSNGRMHKARLWLAPKSRWR